MLGHRAFLIGALLFSLLIITLRLSYWWLLPIWAVYLGTAVYGSIRISSSWYLKAHCKAPNPTQKTIALTFDDGVDEQITPQVLDILKKHGVNATFFCIGANLTSPIQQQLLQQAHKQGHLIGNHSYSHSYFFDFFTRWQVGRELRQTNSQIEQIIHKKPRLFRPPYGVTNPPIAWAVRKLQLHTIGWSIRSLDTSITNQDKLFDRVEAQLHPGAVLLLHDNHDRIPAFLDRLLEYLLHQGYQVVPLDKLLEIEPYEKSTIHSQPSAVTD